MAMSYSAAMALRARYPTVYLNPMHPEVQAVYDDCKHRLGLRPSDKLRGAQLARMEQDFLYLLPAYIAQRGDSGPPFITINYNDDARAFFMQSGFPQWPDREQLAVFQLNFARQVLGGVALSKCDAPLPPPGGDTL